MEERFQINVNGILRETCNVRKLLIWLNVQRNAPLHRGVSGVAEDIGGEQEDCVPRILLHLIIGDI
jgi:hypothetical protein